MASYALADREPPVVVTNGATVHHRASRLPASWRFIIFMAISSFLRTTLWEYAVNTIGPELGTITREESDFRYVAAVAAFRMLLAYFTWAANYDFVDVSALTVLTNIPYAYLATTYYAISTSTIAAHVAIQVIALAIPTYLLRAPAPYNRNSAPVRNRFLLESTQVQLGTASLAIGTYILAVFGAQKTGWLNIFLLSHFGRIPTLENAHNETYLSLFLKFLTAGWAAKAFLFNPSIGAQTVSGLVTPVEVFNPATATLPATLKKNFWFFSKRTRTVLRQTAVAVVFTMADSVMRIWNMRDTDLVGTLGYSGFWALITVVTAGWYAWVGDTEL